MKYAEYKEEKQHGSRDFPIEYYYVDSEHEQYVMPLHWHREFEIIRVLEGELVLYLNNEEYRLSAGETVYVGPGTLHRGDPVQCVYECVVFDLRMIAGHNMNGVSDAVRPIISSDSEISAVCERADAVAERLLQTLRDHGEYYELIVPSIIGELVYVLYLTGAVTPSQSERKRFTQRRAVMTLLIDKIEKEYTHKITLTDLAEYSHINEKYLCRFFKEFTGQTPIDYINRLRVDRACYEMTVNRMNVTEAAYECGFNELSYFSKCFKKYKGISPGRYKSKYSPK